MIAAAPHRGALADSVELGSCLVAISSSDRADTSLVSSNGTVAAFCGTLDNLEELAGELLGADVSALPSPADVLVAGFHAYGDDLPAHLRGVFTGVLTDGSRLLCFRDHMGYGTLFYRDQPDAFYVATEAKQVVAGAGLRTEPDLDVLEQILYTTYDPRTPSALLGVNRVPKTSVLAVDRQGCRVRRFWDPASLLESAHFTPGELQERFDELMAQATRRTLTGEDVISLSGGIDSPAVAAFAAPEHLRMTGRPLPAQSAVFPDLPSVDERTYIELVAEHLGVPLHTFEPEAHFLDDIQQWARIADGPIPTVSLPQYQESYRRARHLGYRNVLTGELAELVCDMTLFRFPHLLLHGRLSPVWSDIKDRRSRGASLPSIGRSMLSAMVPTTVTRLQWKSRRDGAPAWIDHRRANETSVRSLVPSRERWSTVQLSWLEGVGVSMEAEEICQEMCGVRARRPWTDVDLWEFFLSLPAEVKFPDSRSKTLVRHLLRGKVPDAILDRRDKTAFDDSIMNAVDYAVLRRWLLAPSYQLPGVDYHLLRDRLEREDMDITDVMWAKDLASVHAFLALW
jgi:asparagine synthase (glutamine-hydrolysing)